MRIDLDAVANLRRSVALGQTAIISWSDAAIIARRLSNLEEKRMSELRGLDNWITREPDLDPPEVAVFTESDVAKFVEEMRTKCEAIARDYAEDGDSLRIAYAIAELRRPDNR